MLSYVALKVIWWVLVGVLLIGFAIMDGHDMGVGTLLPFVGKGDVERRVVINSVAPHWDGNQVWFITAGGAIFAAWPAVYATAFSGFYWAMLAVLWSLFFRPVGFDYRSKINNQVWRKTWDIGLFIGGFVPPVIFGVAFGNLLEGVPFHFDENLMPYYTGTFWALLNPFALVCGLVSSAMITCHGAVYLSHRTEGDIQRRAKMAATVFGLVALVLFAVAGVWLAMGIDGYTITSALNPGELPNPLGKTVAQTPGAWLENYHRMPIAMAVPALAFVAGLGAIALVRSGRTLLGFVASSLMLAGIIGTAGVSMFPFVMPSSSDPTSSLTVWDSTSSHLTLNIMFWAAVIFVPIIIFYTRWAYNVMSGKVTVDYIVKNQDTLY
ncbi:MAG: cytochrome d ubiquinol oxidase subunit II [Alphaproteobacteria bacterium]|nr:cytochrome d ubiquinol oxidase subunit II [Alphaproteobacteria bacterium]